MFRKGQIILWETICIRRQMNVFTLRLFCLLTLPFEVCEQIHLLMLVTK